MLIKPQSFYHDCEVVVKFSITSEIVKPRKYVLTACLRRAILSQSIFFTRRTTFSLHNKLCESILNCGESRLLYFYAGCSNVW